MEDNKAKLVTIYTSDNTFDVMNLHNVLKEAGIISHKVNCNTSYVYAVEEAALKVNESDAKKALEIIKNIQNNS